MADRLLKSVLGHRLFKSTEGTPTEAFFVDFSGKSWYNVTLLKITLQRIGNNNVRSSPNSRPTVHCFAIRKGVRSEAKIRSRIQGDI